MLEIHVRPTVFAQAQPLGTLFAKRVCSRVTELKHSIALGALDLSYRRPADPALDVKAWRTQGLGMPLFSIRIFREKLSTLNGYVNKQPLLTGLRMHTGRTDDCPTVLA
jgi:hypothetical protein